MATVHLVRHGSHTEVGRILSGRSDIGLSEQGRCQAQRLGERFGELEVGAIHVSPRTRAVETAGFISRALALPLQIDEAFDEIDFGAWTGKTFAELDDDPLWLRWNEARETARPPEGETMLDATRRAVQRLSEIAAEATRAVVVVSHCDIIRGAIAHYLGLAQDRLLNFDVDPASVSRLSVGSWGGRVLSVNEGWA